MLRLFLGETGLDIINDLETLGYTSRQDAKLGVTYLIFLLKILDNNNDNFKSPVLLLPITITKYFTYNYEKIDMLRIMAGHMFIHIILIEE